MSTPATDAPGYTLLGRIDSPEDLRRLPATELPHLAVEMRRYLIETLGRIGGHFAANLGTVELSVALHRCFETPRDRLVWDVGHQAYPHKMLTGRRARLESIRKLGGLMPFCHRGESEYDTFGVGHSSTSISAAAGMAAAARVKGEKRRAGAIIGETDELGFNSVSDRAHVHDLHATILHLLGVDHKKLTFRFQGRDFRLTDVHGHVIEKLLA